MDSFKLVSSEITLILNFNTTSPLILKWDDLSSPFADWHIQYNLIIMPWKLIITYIKIITVDWHRDVASQWVQETCANCIIAPSTTHQWDKYKSLLHMRCMYVIVCIYLREKYLIILLLCGILYHLMIFDASPRTWVWCITSVARINLVFIWDPWTFTFW